MPIATAAALRTLRLPPSPMAITAAGVNRSVLRSFERQKCGPKSREAAKYGHNSEQIVNFFRSICSLQRS
jgi:hypothetical protein